MNIFGKKTDRAVPEAGQSTQKTPDKEVGDDGQRSMFPPTPARNPKMLNATQLQRTKEMKRLAETKLSNIEDRLEHLRKQQEWLRRYNKLKMELEQEKARLFELNKMQSSMMEDVRQLERYEMFESIQSTYQRMTVLEDLAAKNKRNLSVLERDSEDLRQSWNEQEKQQSQTESVCRSAEKKFYDIHDDIFLALQLYGSSQAYEEDITYLNELSEKACQQANVLENNIAETSQAIETLSEKLSRHKAERQSMEMHEQMLDHSEKILLHLDNLQEIEEQQQILRNLQADAFRKQNEENMLLERVFSKYQEISSEIEILEGELQTHRTNILGQDSYKLQERAMQLKSRKQMLLAAQSLWHQISTGYNAIEEKTKKLNELRLHIEQTERNIKEMEAEVGKLSRLCHEKEHTYLLSKGQNIIQLRSNLKEGTSCAVCGATHHPYHSDTMLDQSKLISEFRTDYELLAAEVHNKQQQLNDLRLDLAESKGRQFAEESALNTIRLRQNDDVKEWNIYVPLDKSFEDCSAGTNLDARTAMIRHLIESTANDAEKAQKELDVFNYHTSQITKLTEELQTLELRKNELGVRLNEVNTGCQVRAGQVERAQSMTECENNRFREVYNQLEKGITIKEWKNIWDNNRENLRKQIQMMANAWNTVNEQINSEQNMLELNETQLESLLQQQKTVNSYSELLKNRIQERYNSIEENDKNIKRSTEKLGPKPLYEETYQKMTEAKEAEQREMMKSKKILHDIDYIRGRNEFYLMFGKELSEKLREERSRLDTWIHNFNMNHPPVQYAELEDVFGGEKDWEGIRLRVRKITQDIILCQAHVEDLNSRFIALQAEGSYQTANEEKLQETMAAQQESLEGKRREIMMQIARQAVALEEHEKAVHSANNSAQIQDPDSTIY